MRPSLRTLIVGASYCALDVAFEAATHGLHAGNGVPVRHVAGMALAVLALGGLPMVPWVLLANLITGLIFHTPGYPLWIRLVLTLLFTAGYSLTAWIVRRRLGPAPLPRDRHEAVYLVIAGLAAPMLIAILASVVLLAGGLIPLSGLVESAFFRTASNAASILTIVPFVAIFIAPALVSEAPRRLKLNLECRPGECAVQLLSLVASLACAFAVPSLHDYHLTELCLAPLAWIALSHGLPGATLATLVVNVGGYLAMRFTHASPLEVGDFLVFSLANASVGLGLGTVVSLRDEDRAQLAESRAQLEQVLASARLGCWDHDLERGQTTFDETWAEMLGYSRAEVRQESGWWRERVHPEDLPRVDELLQKHYAGQTPFYEADYRMRTRQGGWKWIHARGSVVARDAEGKPLRIAGTHQDLTERREAEAEKNRLLHIIETSPDYIGSADLNQRFVHVNPAFRRLLGISSFDSPGNLSITDFHPPWAAQKIANEGIPHALSHGLWVGETALRDRHGREFPVSQLIIVQRDDEGNPTLLSTIARDISKIKEIEAARLATERKMLQAQKLESLGVLAGGIAHDFNNLLTVMLGNASLAELDLPPDSPAQSYLEQIKLSAIRAAELCKQMLAYSGRGQFSPANTDLSALVDDTSHLLHVSISKKCVLKLELERHLPPVHVDATQIRQIVMNLVINASDAIGERSGVIHLTTGLARVDQAYLAEASPTGELPPGDYVYLEVTDNGCGMTPEVKARIFEPFFTTKFAGRGLGLAAVLGIVRGHQGALKVTSDPGRGSVFRLLLPAVRGVAASPAAPSHPRPGPVPTGKILVVDDEETVRVIAARILESEGFGTELAADGLDAVNIFRQRPGDFLAVLLDLTMPHMNGEQAFREIRRIRADVPIVLMSGFSEEDSIDRFAGRELAGFLPKPFDRESLVRCFRGVLKSDPSGPN